MTFYKERRFNLNYSDKQSHDVAMLYIKLKFKDSQPSAEQLTLEYCAARDRVKEIIEKSEDDSTGEAPEWT
jgi:hypothetical protein